MRIVVIGEGIISAIGRNKKEVLASLLEKRSGIGTVRYLPTKHTEFPVGEVKLSNGELKRILNIPPDKEVSRTSLLAIHAILEAKHDAFEDQYTCPGKRIAFISGTTVGGMDVTERRFLEGQMYGDADFIKNHDCGGNTSEIAGFLGDISETITISTACSSAANAIIIGAEMLRNGEADIVIAGGSESLSLFHLNGFNSLMILDHQPCRPFDADRAGLNLGEGAAYVILEREEDANAHSHPTHAFINGYGNACDAYHQTATSPNGEGAWLAMRMAMSMAGVEAGDIDYVNAHGTGTTNNDETELVALRRIFGESLPPISSTKAFTGHTTSASGAIETVICILAMQHGFIPASLNWQTPMPGGFTPSSGKEPASLDNVLCNSFGFGGNDSSILISKDAGKALPQWQFSDDDVEIVATAEVDSEDELKSIREFISPMEARRMGRLMRAALLTSFRVLRKAAIDTPDAIIAGTAHGCVENSEKLLLQLRDQGEESSSPTLFMQSTHNTIAAAIAMQTHCHGYNITYSQGDDSLALALRDARRLLRSGECKNVLVGVHDESTTLLRELMTRAGLKEPQSIYSKSILLRCRK